MTNILREKKEIKSLIPYCRDCGRSDYITEVRYECLGCELCKAENIGFRIDKLGKD
jgi:hypothetical protein